MNCKICGHRTNTLNTMRDHYYKKHPDAMKRRKTTSKKTLNNRKNDLISQLKQLIKDNE